MYFSGISINLISMSGLAVSVGMLVDNSVVVIENTVRLRRQGVPAPKAAVAGAKQVSAAITASTLTTICVFVPIIFTDGLTRQLFTDMALTVAYTLIASLIIALTLVPAMSSKLLANTKETEGKYYMALLDKYKTSISYVLKHKVPILLLAVILLLGSIYFSLQKGFIFMPEMSSPQIQATMEMPKGQQPGRDKGNSRRSHQKDRNDQGCRYSRRDFVYRRHDGRRHYTSLRFLLIMLNEKMEHTSTWVADKINDVCKDLKGLVTAAGSSTGDFTTALGGSGVSINVYSADLDHLQETAKESAQSWQR